MILKKLFIIYFIIFLNIFATVIYKDKNFNLKFNTESIREVQPPIIYNNGILFTCTWEENSIVYLSGNFLNWQDKKLMLKNKYGIYYYFLTIELNKGTYAYRYMVNDIWYNDKLQDQIVDDSYGSKISAITLKKDLHLYLSNPKNIKENEYQFFFENNNYNSVSLICNENSWNPFIDEMKLNNDNYWVINKKISTKYLNKNKPFYYKFYADGQEMLDPLNIDIVNTSQDNPLNIASFKISKESK